MSTNNIVNVGIPPPQEFEDWTTNEIRFHGFANLSTTRGARVDSPEFSCLGHQWKLSIYPGGSAGSLTGHIAIRLSNISNTGIEIKYSYSVKDSDGHMRIASAFANAESVTTEFGAFGSEDNTKYISNFVQKSRVMELLVNGSLIIVVRMKSTSTEKYIPQFIPTNPINENVLQKFMDEETADVVFEFDNDSSSQSEEHTNKKSKTTQSLYAHRFIVQDISITLAELCKQNEDGILTIVSIADVTPDIFRHMLYYSYGGKVSADILKDNAKDIINACDKYGLVQLKLEAEAAYVKSTEFTVENMMDNLLYADSKNLAFLKEAVTDYIVEQKHNIIGKVSLGNFPSHLVTDLLAAMARGEEYMEDDVGEDKETVKYNKMRVGTLRKMLDEKGLEVDGSREAMIALLKENSAQ